ncbi:hypothetical protein FRB99_005910 [Tulasnella sp. 403]|nr:hypothetical protein FRB99_005910 [Tulasnella sp. 403]
MFQYFVTVVPTVYRAPRSAPVRTNQYSVTSYRRTLQHGRGAPGIFFKFDIDPMEMTVWQRTTSFTQFIMRLCGVVGGVWVCAGWAVKVGSKAAVVVTGKDDSDSEIVNEAQLRKKASKRWAGGELRARAPATNGNWAIDGNSPYAQTFSPYASSPYAGTPILSLNGYAATPNTANGYAPSPTTNGHTNGATPANIPSPGTPSGPFVANGMKSSPPRAGLGLSAPHHTGYFPPQMDHRDSSYSMPSTPTPGNGNGDHTRPKLNVKLGVDKRID